MSAARRLLAFVLALALAVPPAVGFAAPAPAYDHRWAAEAMLVGSLGATQRTVLEDGMRLAYSAGTYSGTVVYRDVLGMSEPAGITSQVSDIHLTLTGGPLEGGSSAGGTFVGTAVLVTRQASSLSEAASADITRVGGGERVTYDVAGHWAARLTNTSASGELVYESVRAQSAPGTTGRDAAWFNRASTANPDGLGEGQPFAVAVTGLENRRDGSTASTRTAPEALAAPRVSAFEYVRRGIKGVRPATTMPVPDASARAARDLRDSAPLGATPLPAGSVSIDLDAAGAYLDAKNRAAGLDVVSSAGAALAAKARVEFDRIRLSAPGRPLVAPDADMGIALAKQLGSWLAVLERDGVPGASALARDVAAIGPGVDADTVLLLRTWLAVAEATQRPAAPGDLAPVARDGARAVAGTALPRSGAAADAVLAAADSASAPDGAVRLAAFERVASRDSSGTGGGELPAAVLALAAPDGSGAPGLTVIGTAGAERVAPSSWLAYRRADGAVYWLAGEDGRLALADASLDGWCWGVRRAALVDAGRVGRRLAYFSAR